MLRKRKANEALLISFFILASHLSVFAQQGDKPVQPAPVTTTMPAGSVDVSAQVDMLSKKVEQLESLVEQQQQVLTELKKQLAENASRETGSTDAASPKLMNASLNGAQSLTQPVKPAQAVQSKDQKPVALAGWDDNHAFLRNSDGSFLTYVTGYAQLDFRGYQGGNHPPNTFLVRRARISLEGKVARYYDFKVEGDFADTTSTLLRDFYLRIHRIDELQFTAGQFREPFSQEEIRPDPYQDFVERSMANNLAPSRSPGVMVSGILHKGAFEYQAGAFNGKGLLATNTTGTPEGAVRLRFAPWKNTKSFWVDGLAFGGAVALGRSAIGTQSIRGVTESRSFTFFTPDLVNGPINRANGEVTWLLGPAAIRAEYDQVNQARTALGPKGTSLPGVVSKAYMGQFTYLLTGEKKPDSAALTPRHNLFGDSKNPVGFGAWELKARYSNLQISDGTAKSNRAGTFYFGANWYLNRFVRYELDLGFEKYKDPIRTPRPGDNNYFVVLSRIQVAF